MISCRGGWMNLSEAEYKKQRNKKGTGIYEEAPE
jgi:hypothetical protein